MTVGSHNDHIRRLVRGAGQNRVADIQVAGNRLQDLRSDAVILEARGNPGGRSSDRREDHRK